MNQIQTLNKIFLKLFIYVIIIVNSLDNTDKYVCKNIRIKVETKLIYTLNRAWDTFLLWYQHQNVQTFYNNTYVLFYKAPLTQFNIINVIRLSKYVIFLYWNRKKKEEKLTSLLVCITGIKLRRTQAGQTRRRNFPGISKELRSAFYHTWWRSEPKPKQGISMTAHR